MKYWSVAVGCALLPALAIAEVPQKGFGVQLAYVSNEGPAGSDFDGSFRMEAFGQLVFNPNIAFEAGVAHSTRTQDSDEDNQGVYTLDISSTDLQAGMRVDSQPFGALNFYGRAGLLYYYSTLEFEESFFGIKPGGKLEEIEEGIGYYLQGGAAFVVAPNLKLDVGLSYRVRQDYFEDASRPFDMKEIGVGVGLVFATP